MIYSWQKQQWQTVLAARQLSRLPHAILFFGPEGTGKQSFAEQLSHAILCKQPHDDGLACGQCDACHLLAAGTHPDQTLIVPVPGEKSTSKDPVLAIRIETIRALCSKLAETSQFGGYRIVIIKQADQMTNGAASALLKTLEEPGDSTLILLVTSNPHQLLKTIRSRCQSIAFPAPEKQDALKWLNSQGVKDAEQALDLAHGAPLLASSFVEQDMDNLELFEKALLAASNGQLSISYAQKLAKLPKQTALSWFQDWVIDLIKLKQCVNGAAIINEKHRNSLQKLALKADFTRTFTLYDQLCRYIYKDEIKLNPELLWENLLISWDNL